jgi:2-polyprenyl-3-methyl-5-hydroxy-6-metoxy-1,4-benzoquinol methylase
MAYDWHSKLTAPRFSREWFASVDRAFLTRRPPVRDASHGLRPRHPVRPNSGRRVLEIGCGMGLHSELMTAAGADLVSIDLADTSIEATRRRLELKGLKARVERADAEQLPFEACSFDFVWSWGVIHHSARTARIAREIGRFVRGDGAARIMFYNREGTAARVRLLKDHLLRGAFLRRSLDETFFRATDGLSTRYYVREQFEDLFRAFFEEVSSEVVGQDADVCRCPAAPAELGAPCLA